MKVKLIESAAIEVSLSEFLAREDVTVHSVSYAIGPEGEREALVLYSEGGAAELPGALRTWLAEQLKAS
jgi:hypothetical protein